MFTTSGFQVGSKTVTRRRDPRLLRLRIDHPLQATLAVLGVALAAEIVQNVVDYLADADLTGTLHELAFIGLILALAAGVGVFFREALLG